jgi:hypothetical protein
MQQVSLHRQTCFFIYKSGAREVVFIWQSLPQRVSILNFNMTILAKLHPSYPAYPVHNWCAFPSGKLSKPEWWERWGWVATPWARVSKEGRMVFIEADKRYMSPTIICRLRQAGLNPQEEGIEFMRVLYQPWAAITKTEKSSLLGKGSVRQRVSI